MNFWIYITTLVCLCVVNVKCQPTTPESRREYALKNLIPDKQSCGTQNGTENVNELPWVAFLSCENSDGSIASSFSSGTGFAVTSRDCDCSGTLISEQYVLTTSNCDSAKWAGLGQSEQNRYVSCTTTNSDGDCSEPAEKTPIAEKIPHPDNTLLLLRLRNKIKYSDSIRPICLPLEEDGLKDIGEAITSSRWKIDEKVRGFLKSTVSQTTTKNENCAKNFEFLELTNSPKYLCTEFEDSAGLLCKTDSGSPMMYKRNGNWFVGGVLHAQICLDTTAVGNRITPDVVNWILENMKP